MAYVSVNGQNVQTLNGTLVAQDANFVTFKYKKPRSSKFIEERISTKDILSVYGKVGQEGAQLVRKVIGEVTGYSGEVSQDKAGNIVVTDAEGVPMTFYSQPGYSVNSYEEVDA